MKVKTIYRVSSRSSPAFHSTGKEERESEVDGMVSFWFKTQKITIFSAQTLS